MSSGKGRPKWFTRDDVEKAIAMKAEGKPVKEIAIALRRTSTSIHNLFYRVRNGETPGSGPGRSWTSEEHDIAVKMRREGASYAVIGRKLGRSAGSVDGHFRGRKAKSRSSQSSTGRKDLKGRLADADAGTSPKRAGRRRWCYILGDQEVPVEKSDHLPPGGQFGWRYL